MTPLAVPDREHLLDAPTTIVEVFADVSCPFAHVGLRRFVEQRALVLTGRPRPSSPRVAARARQWLSARSPNRPRHMSRSFATKSHPISSPASTLDRSPNRHSRRWDWRPPHIGSAIASGNGSAWRYAMLSSKPAATSATRRYSERSRPNRESSVPTSDAVDAVIADWEEGKRRGVRGSPEFFVKGRGYFCPTLDITRVGGQLHIVRDIDETRPRSSMRCSRTERLICRRPSSCHSTDRRSRSVHSDLQARSRGEPALTSSS